MDKPVKKKKDEYIMQFEQQQMQQAQTQQKVTQETEVIEID